MTTPRKLQLAQKIAEAVKSQCPTTVSELQSFLSLCNVFCRLVPCFKRLAFPLKEKLRKGELLQLELDTNKRKAVEALKDKLIAPTIVALPRLNGKFTIITDACDIQVGCVLLQEQEYKVLKPVG